MVWPAEPGKLGLERFSIRLSTASGEVCESGNGRGRAIGKLQPFLTPARRSQDRTPPTVLKPQRYPYNPGTWNFGWFNRNPPADNSYRKKLPSEFYVWTHAYDIAGIASANLMVRLDNDGTNTLANNQNETYADGTEVGSWVGVPMTKQALPNSQAALNAAANSGEINYFITPPELADYYFAIVTDAALPGFRGKLVDYYIEAADSLGNVSKSDIQHVFVEDDGSVAPVVPAVPSGLSAIAMDSTTISLTWNAAPGAADYVIYRNGVLAGSPGQTAFTDTGLVPATGYRYSVSAKNAAGESVQSAAVQATTMSAGVQPAQFSMDGIADSEGYQLSSPGMTILAALRGNILYVATWAPGEAGNDHFLFICRDALPVATAAAPWEKAGLVALPADSPVLAAESSNSYIGWSHDNGAATETGRAAGARMEGTIGLAVAFGALPETLYLASAAYRTADAGALAAQAPAGNGDGDIGPDELFAIPLEALRDEDANGIFDRLETGRGFVITKASRAGNSLSLTWNCFPGRSYRIQSGMELGTDCTDIPGAPITAGPADLTATVALAVDPREPRRFYRIALVP